MVNRACEVFETSPESLTSSPFANCGFCEMKLAEMRDFHQLKPIDDDFQIVDKPPKAASNIFELYRNTVDDKSTSEDDQTADARVAAFQQRMEKVADYDPATSEALKKLADQITAQPPVSPEAVGADLAKIFAETIARHDGKEKYDSPEIDNLLKTMAGMMLATQSTFQEPSGPGQPTEKEQTAAMITSMNEQLKKDKIDFLYGVVWFDGEPGMAIVKPGDEINIYHYGQ